MMKPLVFVKRSMTAAIILTAILCGPVFAADVGGKEGADRRVEALFLGTKG